MDRRRFLSLAGGFAAGPALAGEAAAHHEGDEANPTPADGTTAYRSKVTTIRAPLAGVPAIEVAGDHIRVELDPADVGGETPEATLVPSFGDVEMATELDHRETRTGETSAIWNAAEHEADQVTAVTYRIPGFHPQDGFTPGLYDLHVSWSSGSDSQPRAVSIREEIPSVPEVVVIADPQIADPRAMQAGFEESVNKREPDPVITRTTRLVGDSPDNRWEAARRSVAEVNALDPDLVLVAGDVTFGQDAPGKYYAEYEDAWEIINDLRVPSFCTLGNHDGYVQSGVDGKALYRETFGPPSYSVDIGDLHLVAVDTYDWSYLDRKTVTAATGSWGGQVRDPQYAWLRDDLEASDGTILVFGHHNPSWQWDGDHPPEEHTEGTPVLEQAGRGSRFFTTGQGWTGTQHHFDLRQLFDAVGVCAYFAGHSHRDRIARYVPPETDGDYGDFVETPGPSTTRDGTYHYVAYEDRDGDGRPEGQVTKREDPVPDTTTPLQATIEDDSGGPLYVNTTTAASGTGQYWGWRPLSVDTESSTVTIDSDNYGYPMTQEFLDDRAVNPGNWNPDQDEVGLYSHPSYLFAVDSTGSGQHMEIQIQNGLATPVEGALLQSMDACPGVAVDGGDIVWRRHGNDRQVVKVAFSVDGESEHSITLACRP